VFGPDISEQHSICADRSTEVPSGVVEAVNGNINTPEAAIKLL
jgi:hypothetical protein